MGRGVERVRELAGSLAREFGNETVVGLSSVEIVEVATALGGHELPSSYVEFLRLMGKVAGRMLVGTDIFYPRLLKVKEYAQELFEETGRVDLMSDTSIVFALHQGYQVYWFVDIVTQIMTSLKITRIRIRIVLLYKKTGKGL